MSNVLVIDKFLFNHDGYELCTNENLIKYIKEINFTFKRSKKLVKVIPSNVYENGCQRLVEFIIEEKMIYINISEATILNYYLNRDNKIICIDTKFKI